LTESSFSSPEIPAGPGDWAERLLGLGPRPLVLASASPRRASLLRELGVRFTIRPARVSEEIQPGEGPESVTLRLAREKAMAGSRPGVDELVLGADTLVVVGERVLGKPEDGREARAMLQELSGGDHWVITGLAVVRSLDNECFAGTQRTRVRFRELTGLDIDVLVESGESRDKAGAYGIQGLASLVVEEIEGDYFNVVGLPLGLLRTLLHEEAGE